MLFIRRAGSLQQLPAHAQTDRERPEPLRFVGRTLGYRILLDTRTVLDLDIGYWYIGYRISDIRYHGLQEAHGSEPSSRLSCR